MIRVWDAETGNVVIGPLRGHEDYVTSVGFSQDGRCIVSGSRDKTIRVWDAETGDVVIGPLGGHRGLGHVRWILAGWQAHRLGLSRQDDPGLGYGVRERREWAIART
jgi:WD40 repeat protein